jgi:hypothetical protein
MRYELPEGHTVRINHRRINDILGEYLNDSNPAERRYRIDRWAIPVRELKEMGATIEPRGGQSGFRFILTDMLRA